MRSISLNHRALRLIGAGALCLAVATTVVTSASGAGTHSQVVVKSFKSATVGTFLTTMSGMPLYYSTHDKRDHSNCTGGCLSFWPALTVAKNVRPTGTTGLGTFKRPNGKIQVTWHGWPVYRFASDGADHPTGNGVNGFKLIVIKPPRTSGTTTTIGYAGTTTTTGSVTTTMVGATSTLPYSMSASSGR
ncbi:MAG TPA: hypothetical protein VGS61_03910 [Acidimicrobiales bacterium]|nr:hypothetical protein [Acidimicrobiales bacterium]